MSVERAEVEVYLPVTTTPDRLASELVDAEPGRAWLRDLVLAVDAEVGELAFTRELRDRLAAVLAAEEAP